MSDLINRPEHYNQVGFECIDMMKLFFKERESLLYGYLLGNAFKYIWRHKSKGGETDLKKAEWYLNYAKELGIGVFDTESKNCYEYLLQSLKKIRGGE